MSELLIKFTQKHFKNYRNGLGVVSGIVGILCNILLCVVKFVLGSFTGSVSITADALNNLSDAASNVITIVSTKLSSKPIDKQHPFGHGRLEYVSALVVAFMIFLMGFELAKNSVEKIIHPTELKFNFIYVAIMLVAILVKVWMAYFNKKLFKITDNINLKAVSQDSLNDCISTFATVIAIVVCHYFNLYWFDGAIGLCVSAFIIYSGISVVRDILNPLLGQAPSQELVDNIKSIMLEEDLILGVHDLIVHDYGPGRIIASAHAEVPSNIDIMKIHDVIDNVEQKISKKLNIVICIHMDPIVVNDSEVEYYKSICLRIIKTYNPSYSFHDFRMVKGDTHINLIFDVVTAFDKNYDENKIKSDLVKMFKQEDEKLNLVINLEHSYI